MAKIYIVCKFSQSIIIEKFLLDHSAALIIVLQAKAAISNINENIEIMENLLKNHEHFLKLNYRREHEIKNSTDNEIHYMYYIKEVLRKYNHLSKTNGIFLGLV